MSRAPSGLGGALCQVGHFHRAEKTHPCEFGRAQAPRRTHAAKLLRAPRSGRKTVCKDLWDPAARLIVPWRAHSAGLAVLRVTRRARSAKLPHRDSRATQTEARALQTPRARGWGAPQGPHSTPPSPSRCSPQSTSGLGPSHQFRDSVPIARPLIPASAFRVPWMLGARVCRNYRVPRRSPSGPCGIRCGLPASQNLRPLASAPVLVRRR